MVIKKDRLRKEAELFDLLGRERYISLECDSQLLDWVCILINWGVCQVCYIHKFINYSSYRTPKEMKVYITLGSVPFGLGFGKDCASSLFKRISWNHQQNWVAPLWMMGNDQERVFMAQEKCRHGQIDLQYYLTQRVANLGINLSWMKLFYLGWKWNMRFYIYVNSINKNASRLRKQYHCLTSDSWILAIDLW